MSILSTSPTSIRVFDVNIANALGSSEAATILQQLHYWMQKPSVGVIVDGVKYVYNTFRQWIKEQFLYLSESKFINAMKILRSYEIVKVDRCKAKNWNQTNHYSLNYQKLREWAKAENIEISELADKPSQDEEKRSLEMSDSEVSLYEPKNTNHKKLTTKQDQSDRQSEKLTPFAAASLKSAKEAEENQKGSIPYSVKLICEAVSFRTASAEQNKVQSELNKPNIVKETNIAQVDHIINLKWEKLIPELDKAGIPINKTIKDLLKLYPFEKLKDAIALLRARKRDSHIPNPSGYFVAALKGDWSSKTVINNEGDRSNQTIDKAAVFRHWYDLAKELGYCSGTEVRFGEQWICLSGTWERWETAQGRGYSLEYLKKIMKRNRS